MGKAWDILPPTARPHKTHAKSEKKRSKNCSLFFLICFIVVVGFFIFQISDYTPSGINGTETTKPAVIPNNNQSAETSIKILNGSGKAEEASNVSSILTNAGYKVSKTENALNIYDKSIVYYQEPEKDKAEKIASLLKNYNAITQKFTQETSFDIVVVLSAR